MPSRTDRPSRGSGPSRRADAAHRTGGAAAHRAGGIVHSKGTGPIALPPASRLLWAGTGLVIALAVARALIFFAPHRWFDVDPAVDPNPLRGLGPAGSLWLDAALIAAAGLVHLGLWRARRTVRLAPLILAAIPGLAILIHGWSDGADAWQGLTWLAAALAAAAIYSALTSRPIDDPAPPAATSERDATPDDSRLSPHLGLLRITCLALLLASAGPLLVRGLANVTFEHRQTVEQFEAQKEQFFADRGWDPDGASAQIFERRLRQAQPTGWFTSTNVFGSLVLVMAVVLLGLAVAAVTPGLRPADPAHRSPAHAVFLFALAVAALSAVWMTDSLGAIVALAVALGILAFAWGVQFVIRHRDGGDDATPDDPPTPALQSRAQRPLAFMLIAIPLAAVVATISAVVVRGIILPESFAGDRSLLFRWHYMHASWSMWLDDPLLGTGPAGYQASYLLHRLPRSPEEVASAHNAILDWLVTLGLPALAWIGLLGAGLLTIGRGLLPPPRSTSPTEAHEPLGSNDRPLPRAIQWTILGASILVVGPSLAVELPAFLAVGDQASVLSRLAGAISYPLLAWLLARILLVARPAVLAVALAAGATGLAIHAQIEMTATQPGSAAWFALALALAAAFAQVHDRPNLAASRPRLSHRPRAAGIALGLVAFALFIAIVFAHPAYEQEQWEAAAAEPLRPVAQTLAAGEPIDANALIAGRLAAADRLEHAYAAWPARPWPLLAAARQLERTADLVQGNEEREALLVRALLLAELAADLSEQAGVSARPQAAFIAWRLAELNVDAAMRAEAIRLMEDIAAHDPHSLRTRLRLAQMYDAADRTSDAIAAYERTLAIDANFELDPLKQLSPDERDRIEQRLADLKQSNASPVAPDDPAARP